MALIDDFKSNFPEFDETKVDQQFQKLEAIWPILFNRDYINNEQSVLHLIAHLFVVETKPGSSANRLLESKSAGSISGSYATLKTSPDEFDEFLKTTKYGQLFLLLTHHKGQGGVPV